MKSRQRAAYRHIITRKPRRRKETGDAAAVLFGLKFADNIHYKLKSSQASKVMLHSSKHTGTKQNLTQKWRFKVIQGHVFWSQWKGGKVLLSNNIL